MKTTQGVAVFIAIPIAALGAMCAYSIAKGDVEGAAIFGFVVVFVIVLLLVSEG